MLNYRPTGAYERGQTVSIEGFPIRNPPNRMLMPSEYENLPHENTFFSRIFDLEDAEQTKEYHEVMNRIVNGSARKLVKQLLSPTDAHPTVRWLVEWYETEAVFQESTPNQRYTRRWKS